MNPGRYLLSKTTLLKFKQCAKALYLHVHKPQLRDPIAPELKHRFLQGNQIGLLAHQLFPGGIDVSKQARTNSDRLQLTQQLLTQNQRVLYEATFECKGLLVMVDILVHTGTELLAYEVKSSTRITETYLSDAQLQFWVLKQVFKQPVKMHLIGINPQYRLNGSLDLKSYFKIYPLQEEPSQNLSTEQDVASGHRVLESSQAPTLLPGKHCLKPYKCDFFNHCNPQKSQHGIPIPQMSQEVLESWNQKKYFDFIDLPINELPAKYQRIRWAIQKQSWYLDTDFYQHWKQGIALPVASMDLETWTSPLPEIQATGPWESIPFLAAVYSHSQGLQCAFVDHTETDQRYAFTCQLLKLTEPFASILVFDKTLETLTLQTIAGLYPDLKQACNNLIDKFKIGRAHV